MTSAKKRVVNGGRREGVEAKLKATEIEEEFNDLVDFSIASNAPFGEILENRRKRLGARSGLHGEGVGIPNHTHTRVVIWLGVAIIELSNIITPDLRSMGRFLPNRLFCFRQVISVPRSMYPMY
ncbi:hypothetical protein TNCV_394591 [Trichonephila clavipes]|nr:hypothetical protein TNCV_394591 [Trichonephila clavipes]